jgi:N-acetyl-anhydromuramyl-L-alanine amidase AmpD
LSPLEGVTVERWASKRFGGVGAPKIATRTRPVRAIVIHSTEGGEKLGSARSVASWLDNPGAKGNYHYICDASGVIQFVPDARAAWHANAANQWTIGVALCGTAKQTREQWLDPLSSAGLTNAARLCASLCIEHGIDVAKLTHEQIRAVSSKSSDATGFLGHVDVRDALGSGTHWDPGEGFPYLEFLLAVRGYVELAGT